MKLTLKIIATLLIVNGVFMLHASKKQAFEEIRKKEIANPNFFQPGWLVERIKIGDLNGVKKEIDWDSFAIGGTEKSLKNAGKDTLLIIASKAYMNAPEDQKVKFIDIIDQLYRKKEIEKRGWIGDADTELGRAIQDINATLTGRRMVPIKF